MNILVLNSGSSSVKFQVIETGIERMEQDLDRCLVEGQIDRIGGKSTLTFTADGRKFKEARPIRNHTQAIEIILDLLSRGDSRLVEHMGKISLDGAGHRVVHGGEFFSKSVKIDEEVLEVVASCTDLAPLHNPANLAGIRAVMKVKGKSFPQVAVFDTAFHASMPERSYLYAIPYQLYRRHKIRRYGFHGTSHRYIAYRYRKVKKMEKSEVDIVSLHLGNGSSACAVLEGRSLDNSMGFTPLEGLVMGTRSGDLDPSILEYIAGVEGMSLHEVDTMLNKNSGLLGISGLTADMRDLLAEWKDTQDRRCGLAIDIFCSRVRKYIGGYLANMGKADALCFSGGIGENSWEIRQRICENLGFFGIYLDKTKNKKVRREDGPTALHTAKSKVEIWMIPTNEELLIARDTVRCIQPVEQNVAVTT